MRIHVSVMQDICEKRGSLFLDEHTRTHTRVKTNAHGAGFDFNNNVALSKHPLFASLKPHSYVGHTIIYRGVTPEKNIEHYKTLQNAIRKNHRRICQFMYLRVLKIN